MTNELRDQLRSLDPMSPDVFIEPATSESSKHRLERIMSTTTHPTRTRKPVPRWQIAVASLAVAAAAAGTAYVVSGNETSPYGGPPLALSLGSSDSMAMCLQFDVAILAGMSPAFAGTVTAIGNEQVTLTVDHWYAGGDAAEVTLNGATGPSGLLGEIDFQVGGEYLITAANGQVNYCGYSGEATPEFRAAFDSAFGS